MKKKFTFKYPVIVWILLSLLCLVSITGLVFNIVTLVTFKEDVDAFKIVITVFMIVLTIALFAFSLSITFYGKYVIKNDTVYCHLGFVRYKTPIKDIFALTNFKLTKKLVAYFNDGNFTVIVISPSKFDDFARAIREINPSIIYNEDATTNENTPSL